MARDSYVFYASFYEAMRCLADADYIAVSKAVNEYALYGNEIELDGIANGFFQLIKPQLDANIRRRENGLKGGAPSGNRNARKQPDTTELDFVNNLKQPNNNQKTTEVNFENNLKQPNVNVNANVNVNDNVNVNEKEIVEKNAVADATTPTTENDFSANPIENPASPEKEKGCAEKEKAKAKTIEERAIDFWNELERYKGSYGCEMLQAFYAYWTEYNDGGRKMRFELQKIFNLQRRLATWAANEKKFGRTAAAPKNAGTNDIESIWKK